MNPLIKTNDRSIKGWGTWKRLWDEVQVIEFRHSLLHFGFDVPISDTEEWADRIKTYLSIADGWQESTELFVAEDERAVYEASRSDHRAGKTWYIRQQTAMRAFEVLCLRLFKQSEGKFFHERKECPLFPSVLAPIVDFFLLRSQKPLHIAGRNFPSSTQQICNHRFVHVQTFVQKMIDQYWDMELVLEHVSASLKDDLLSLYPAIRPKFIVLLNDIDQLSLLLRDPYTRHLDDACYQALEKMALEPARYFPQEGGSRLPATVEEAAYVGSVPARILLLLKGFKVEENRMNQIAEIKRRQKTDEKALKELVNT